MRCLKLTVITYVSCLLLFGMALSPSQGFSSDMTSEEISKIADEGKDPFIGAVAMAYNLQFGNTEAPKHPDISFEDAMNPISDAYKKLNNDPIVVLGDPFQIYTIETQDILKYSAGTDLSPILVPTTQWFVPVIFSKKSRAILTVDYLDGLWQVVNISMGDTSEKVDKNEKMGVKGNNPKSKFVRIYPVKSDFIVTDTDTNGKNKILPFSYTVVALELDSKKADSSGLYETTDFMPQLSSHVKANITHKVTEEKYDEK